MPPFRNIAAALGAAVVIAASAHAEETFKLEVHDAYARVMTGVGGTGAVFFVLHNHGESDVTLIGASSDLAQMAGLHGHTASADGMMAMAPIEGGIALSAWGEHEFARGGDHVMLMGLKQALKPGDVITLTLTFDRADPLVFEAVIDNDRAP